jgi:hypothetical protein
MVKKRLIIISIFHRFNKKTVGRKNNLERGLNDYLGLWIQHSFFFRER